MKKADAGCGRTPTRLQFQTTECPVAAVRIILAHFGCEPPAEEVRRVAGVSRDCANASDIARVARHYGFTCRTFRREPEELAALGFPLIVHTRFIHFSVLEGMSGKSVHLNDPSSMGHIEVPIEQFRETFTGIAIRIEPGPGVPRPLKPGRMYEPSPFAWHDRRLLIALAASMASVVCLIWLASLLGRWTDSSHARPLLFALLASAALLLRMGFSAGCRILLQRICEAESRTRSDDFLRRLLSLPHDFFLYRMPQRLYETLQSIDKVISARIDRLARAAIELATVPLILGGIWHYDKWIAIAVTPLFLCAAAGTVALSMWRGGIRRQDRSSANPAANADLFEIDRVESYRLGGHDRDLFTSVMGADASRERIRQECDMGPTLAGIVPAMFEFTALTAALSAAILSVNQHRLSPGGMLAALVLTLALRDPLRRLIGVWRQIEYLRLNEPYIADVAACERDTGVIREMPLDAPIGTVRFENVTFGYARLKPPIVDAVSFDVHAGEQLGITGPSGGGKSTVAGLLAGLYRPWSGSARRNGRVAWVTKTPYFIEGTIRENLLLQDPDIDDAALHEAIEDACLADVVAACPEGLATPIDRDGRNFSGGQRQRLEIARALARRPAILILDEATDSLDGELEKRLRNNLRRRRTTLVLISHRAGTLAACDRVVTIAESRPDAADGADLSPAHVPAISRAPNAPMFEAFRLVAAAIGEVVTLPESVECAADAGALPALARHNSLQYRRVRFTAPAWWLRDHGPLIAFSKATGEPVAIVPGSAGIPEGGLESVAWQLYKKTGPDLFRDGIRPARRDFARAAACVPVISALSLAPAALALSLPSAAKLATTLTLAGAALGATFFIRAVAGIRFEGRVRLAALASFVQRFNRIEVRHIRNLTSTAAARSIAAVPRVLDRLVALPLRQMEDAGIAFACLLFLVCIRPGFALPAALLAGPLLVLPALHARRGLPAERRYTDLRISQQRALYTMLQSIAQLRVFDLTSRAADHWFALKAGQRQAGRSIEARNALRPTLGNAWSWGAAIALTAWGSVAAPARPFLLPCLFIVSWQLFAAVGRFGSRLATAMASIPLCEDARALLDGPAEAAGPPAPGGGLQPIEFDRVSYRYPGSRAPVLEDISLRIEPGQIVAITGPSGGGKSTLVRLLLGFDVPASGEIRRWPETRQECTLAKWREGAGAVFQDDRIEADATIRFQIAGSALCNVDEVWRAAEQAGLGDYVRNLPMGMQNIVGPDKISTGQQQRILIARQLLRRPSLLVLDEATNAIPERIQANLLARLRALGLTAILVTHRASAVAMADRVFVVANGKLAFSGAPRELAAEPRFGEMLKAEEESVL